MSEFVAHLHEVFEQFGPIAAKRMFGGHGIYHQGRMFALVADDVLYLKADVESRAAFDALDLPPFTYVKNGKSMTMSYFAAPECIFDDAEEASRWASLAFAAAMRAKK